MTFFLSFIAEDVTRGSWKKYIHLVAHERKNHQPCWSHNEDNVILDYENIVSGTGTCFNWNEVGHKFATCPQKNVTVCYHAWMRAIFHANAVRVVACMGVAIGVAKRTTSIVSVPIHPLVVRMVS